MQVEGSTVTRETRDVAFPHSGVDMACTAPLEFLGDLTRQKSESIILKENILQQHSLQRNIQRNIQPNFTLQLLQIQ